MLRPLETVRPFLVAILSVCAVSALPARAQGGPGVGNPPPPLQPPPVPPGNPITPAKAVLGKLLFFEEQLSADNSVSCATCHIHATGGADPRTGAPNPGRDGIPGTPDDVFGSAGVLRSDAQLDYRPDPTFGFAAQVTDRTAPSAIGSAYFPELFWDGRAPGQFVDPQTGQLQLAAGAALESQAVAPPLSEVEMAHAGVGWGELVQKLAVVEPLKLASSLPPDVVSALAVSPTYPELFQAAFGTPLITADRIARALATYERTLVPDQTPMDAFGAGNQNALSGPQERGFQFFRARNCNACHSASLFSDGSFRNIGVRPPGEDPGRELVTGLPGDRGRFKVPSLRNVGLRPRYFHNGQFTSLGQVVDFYARGGDFRQNQAPQITGFPMNPIQRAELIDFLEHALTDPRVANELPPFDRPRLASEDPARTATLLGGGVAGTGGFVPQMLATAPPSTGTPGFKLGVARGLGNAKALLWIWTPSPAGATGNATVSGGLSSSLLGSATPLNSAAFVLEGSGPGAGFATRHLPLTKGLEGTTVRAQWIVRDPAAPGGFARSEVAELTLF